LTGTASSLTAGATNSFNQVATFPTANDQNFNTLTTGGVYNIVWGNYTGTLNAPGSASNSYGTLLVEPGANFITQTYTPYSPTNPSPWIRTYYAGSWGAWHGVLTDANYNSYSPTLTGTGASGSWSISVTGSAATFTSTSQNSQFNSVGIGTAASTVAGEIRATNNITAYYSSDQRLKTNINPIIGALGIVSAVGGKTFDWTDDYINSHGGEDNYFMRKSDFGIIAQDIERVFPQAVRHRPDGTLAVDYEKLVAVAFQAIVELQEQVNQLKQRQ
jgi:hypothetical protein